MSFFSEIKKLLFVQKAISKSAAEKTAEAGKELGEELLNKSSDLLNRTKGTATDVGGDLLNKAGDTLNTAKDFATDLTKDVWDKASPMMDKAAEYTEDIGGKVMDKAAPLIDKTADLAENVGGVVLDKGGELMGKTMGAAEVLGGKLLEKGSDFMDKAQEMGGELKGKADELVERADRVAKGEETMDTVSDHAKQWGEKLNKETELSGKLGYDEHKGSMLEEHGDFFSKASKWADGNHSAFNDTSLTPDTPIETPIEIPNTPEIAASEMPTLELPADDFVDQAFKGDIHGFDDADGDGDPLIDDAIIEDDSV